MLPRSVAKIFLSSLICIFSLLDYNNCELVVRPVTNGAIYALQENVDISVMKQACTREGFSGFDQFNLTYSSNTDLDLGGFSTMKEVCSVTATNKSYAFVATNVR